MKFKTSIALAALVCGSAAAATLAGPGSTPQISTAHATYSVSLHTYENPAGLVRSGTGFGQQTITIPGSTAITHAEYSPTPYASAYYDNASGSGNGGATNAVTYEYRVKAATQTAADLLAAYLAANNNVGVTATGTITLEEGSASYGRSRGSVFLGAENFSVSCGYNESDSRCGTTSYSAGGLLTDIGNRTFNGLAVLTASSSLNEGGSGFCFGIGPFGGSSHCMGRDYEYAYVDPVIGLANGFKSNPLFNPTDYSIQFSPGIGAVPEPAAWALLVSGFGIVGALQRRRSQPRAFAA